MPGLIDDVVGAVFAGEGVEIALSDHAPGRYPGYVCCVLRGFQVELRGTLDGGLWRETADVSPQALDWPS